MIHLTWESAGVAGDASSLERPGQNMSPTCLRSPGVLGRVDSNDDFLIE